MEQTSGFDMSNMWNGFTSGMKDFGSMLKSKQTLDYANLGLNAYNAYNQNKMSNEQMDIARKQLAMEQDAYAIDKASAEARRNLRF